MRASRATSVWWFVAGAPLLMHASLAVRGVTDMDSDSDGLHDICIVTVNYDKGKNPLSSGDTVDAKEPGPLVAECNGADIVVIATQELINKLVDHFKAYVKAAGKVPHYQVVASCGHKISPGVVVLVKDGKEKLLRSQSGGCADPLKGKDGSWLNDKGSEIGWIYSTQGRRIAFASTHGARGDTISEERVKELRDAAAELLDLNAEVIVWGGDFNPRTPDADAIFGFSQVAFTPPDGAEDVGKYDPRKAMKLLARQEDIFGKEDQTFDELLESTTSGKIVQAPGIRDLCPSYPKKPGPGKYDGKTWKPNLACQSGDGSVEYYTGGVALSGKKNKSPSWPDRILVSSNLNCDPVRKILAEEDHDALLATCRLPKE